MHHDQSKKHVPLPGIRYRHAIYAESRIACKIASFPQKGWCLSKLRTSFPDQLTFLGDSRESPRETPLFSSSFLNYDFSIHKMRSMF